MTYLNSNNIRLSLNIGASYAGNTNLKLCTSNGIHTSFVQKGKRTGQIAAEINSRGLYQRRDKQPVSGKQIYAVAMAHPDTFVKSDGLIRLMI